jgi:hypothetical protein
MSPTAAIRTSGTEGWRNRRQRPPEGLRRLRPLPGRVSDEGVLTASDNPLARDGTPHRHLDTPKGSADCQGCAILSKDARHSLAPRMGSGNPLTRLDGMAMLRSLRAGEPYKKAKGPTMNNLTHWLSPPAPARKRTTPSSRRSQPDHVYRECRDVPPQPPIRHGQRGDAKCEGPSRLKRRCPPGPSRRCPPPIFRLSLQGTKPLDEMDGHA